MVSVQKAQKGFDNSNLFFSTTTLSGHITNMEKRKTKRLHIRIEAELLDKFKAHVEENGYNTSRLIERMIAAFMKGK